MFTGEARVHGWGYRTVGDARRHMTYGRGPTVKAAESDRTAM